MREFNIKAAAATASLMLLFSTQSIAHSPDTQQAVKTSTTQTAIPRYATIMVSHHGNGKREMICDCESLVPVKLNTGETRLTPRVSFAAQFDLSPPRVLLDEFNRMSPAQKQVQLKSMSPYDAAILKSVADLPPSIQERFYIARNDQRLLNTDEAKDLYNYLVMHAVNAHGVDKSDFSNAARLCESYFGIIR